MKYADRIAEGRRFKGKDGHGVALGRILEVLAAQREKLLERNICLFAVTRKVVVDQAGIEQIDACGDRGVRGENVGHPDGLEGLFESESLLLHEDTNAFDAQECGMTFVHVVHGGLDAERLQSSQTTYAENNRLADTLVDVAAIELVRNLAKFGGFVLRDVRVKEIKPNAPDIYVPQLDVELAAWKRD